MFGRRAALDGLDQPEATQAGTAAGAPPQAPSHQTRDAMWRLAGLERTAADLEVLLDDPHPLARLVAACALHREETRGGHARAEFPTSDGRLDFQHSVIKPQGSEPAFVFWD